MAWWIKKQNLSEEQRQYILSIKNNLSHVHWVRGAAGTGKTTVLAALTQELKLEYPNASFCYVTYTHALKALAISAFKEENVEGVHFLTHTQFLQNNWPCDFVFLDEVQDISVQDLDTIKRLATHLIIAGDCAQTIYEHSATESEISNTLNPFQHVLIIIHRLTEFLAKIALSILPNKDLLSGQPANTLPNTTARLFEFNDQRQEFIWVIEQALSRARSNNKPSSILFAFHKDITSFLQTLVLHLCSEEADQVLQYQSAKKDKFNYTQFNQYLKAHNINIRYLGNGFGDFDEMALKPMVYLMTYHSSKGLDFDNVFIPQLNHNKQIVLPFVLDKNPDLDKRLLFVAVTRSRCNLFMSYSSAYPHPLIQNLPNITQIKYQPNQDDEDEEFF